MSNLYNLGQYELEFCPDETLLNYVLGTTNTVELVSVGMALLSILVHRLWTGLVKLPPK